MNFYLSFFNYAFSISLLVACGHAFQIRNNVKRHHTTLFSSQSSQSEARLYKVQNNEEMDVNSHIATLQKITPEIKPNPPVMDAVQEYFPTEYETYRFFPQRNRSKEEITISIRKTSFGCGKLGSSIWRCALALSCNLVSLFDNYDVSELQSMRVVELGAGLGLTSCVCRELGFGSVLATDFWEERESFDKSWDKERLVPHKLFGDNLEFNVVKCAGITSQKHDLETAISVGKLDWASEVDAFKTKMMFDPTLIIGSDVVYNAKDAQPLLRTLELLLGGESSTGTKVEALLFLDFNGRNEEDVNEFRNMAKEMVNSHPGWSLHEEELKLCYWLDETLGSFQEEYFILQLKIANGQFSIWLS